MSSYNEVTFPHNIHRDYPWTLYSQEVLGAPEILDTAAVPLVEQGYYLYPLSAQAVAITSHPTCVDPQQSQLGVPGDDSGNRRMII